MNEIMNETRRDDLLWIEKQAMRLGESAATLRNLHDRESITQTEIHHQTQRMQAAFMAVIRVTSEYL